MFGKKTIRTKVMAVLEKKIEDTQKRHDLRCKELDEQCEKDKNSHAEELINEIVGKWL